MAKPPRLKASDFEPEVLSLFDQYVHGVIDRRGFLIGAARFAGVVGAAGLLAALSPAGFPWAATPVMRTRRAPCSASSTRRRRRRIFLLPRTFFAESRAATSASARPGQRVNAQGDLGPRAFIATICSTSARVSLISAASGCSG